MDFLRIVRSLEDLLYEVMTWLVFYPRTLWRIVTRPMAMALYADAEHTDVSSQAYADALSPPLFLLLTVLVAHAFEVGLAPAAPIAPPHGPAAQGLVSGSEQNMLILQALLFSVFPLVAASTLIRRQRRRLDRVTLRGPFYAQCYLVAPFALAFSLATILARTHGVVHAIGAGLLAAAAVAWYLVVETAWFRTNLLVGRASAIYTAVRMVVEATIYNAVMGSLLGLLM